MKSNVGQLISNAIFSAFMMINLINDLLDLGKLEDNAFKLNYEEFNLIEVIEEAFQIVMFQAQSKDIKLRLVLEAPNTSIFKRVFCDKRRILQIILNFISNSMKFTNPHGFIKVHLRVTEEQMLKSPMIKKKMLRHAISHDEDSLSPGLSRAKVDAEMLKYIKLSITIEDNGVGISSENQDKLFTDYSMLDEHQNMNSSGTGLGLSICKQIIEQMGGSIRIESSLGTGTKFHIELGVKAFENVIKSPPVVFGNKRAESSLNLNLRQKYSPTFDQRFKPVTVSDFAFD